MDDTRQPSARAVVQAIPYFRDIDADSLDQLAQAAHFTNYTKGAVVFHQGDAAKGLYGVVTGRVKAVRYSPNGKEFIVRFFTPHETFNEVGALDGGVNAATAITVEDSQIMTVPTTALRQLLRANPAVDTQIMKAMAQKLRFAMKQVEQLSTVDVKGRTARFLYEQWQSGNSECFLSQEELAAMLGTVRQVLGRALAELQQAGAIAVQRGRVRVTRPEILQSLVAE